jgi:N-acetylglucosamine kinase-like BadF-type ATPase
VYIGIDGGGTRARAVLLDYAGAVVARVDGPAGIVDARDPAAAAGVVAAVAADLLRKAGHAPPAAALCCGLAGAGRDRERAAVTAALEATGVARRVLVLGDAEVAMADAFDSEPGVLLVAGTGSIAWARDTTGAAVRVGGWGRWFGDEGSGYALARDALTAIARAADGRDPPTSLTEHVLRAAACQEPADLIRFAEQAAKRDIAALAPTVLSCAADGDPAALRVRAAAAASLVELAQAAARRAGLASPQVALAGGLIEAGSALRDAVVSGLHAAMPGCAVRPDAVDAARGAARLASGLGTGP